LLSGFPTKIIYAIPLLPLHATYPALLNFHEFICLLTVSEENKSCGLSLCSFLQQHKIIQLRVFSRYGLEVSTFSCHWLVTPRIEAVSPVWTLGGTLFHNFISREITRSYRKCEAFLLFIISVLTLYRHQIKILNAIMYHFRTNIKFCLLP
jgi:hypothetical protein